MKFHTRFFFAALLIQLLSADQLWAAGDTAQSPQSTRPNYAALEASCQNLPSKSIGCCTSSVQRMKTERFAVPSDGKCPEGFRVEMFRCAGSLEWCEPVPGERMCAADKESPESVVNEFYQYHFSHDMSFSRLNLDGRRVWLSDNFYSLLKIQADAPPNPDEVPLIDGDPFTDSQEYPESFSIGSVNLPENGAMVQVNFRWPEQTRQLVVELVKEDGRWAISNLIAHNGESLERVLRAQ